MRHVDAAQHAGANVGALPRTRRRSICDSRNPSRPSVAAPIGATASVKLRGSCTREDGPDRTRPLPGSAAVGFGGGVWAGQGVATAPVEGPRVVTSTRAPRCQASCAARSHAGSHADERPFSSSDSRGQRPTAHPRSRTDLNGSGCPRRYLRVSPRYRCARRRTGVKIGGGTARDVVFSLVAA